MRPAHPVRHQLFGQAGQLPDVSKANRGAARHAAICFDQAGHSGACGWATIFWSPVYAKSRTWRNVLVIAAAVVVLAGLVIGGWHGYAKIRSDRFLNEGLVAYYPLDGNANDASGNNNNGHVALGATPCQDRFGKANSAFSFNGVDNYIRFESVPLKKLDDWSLSAWINPRPLTRTPWPYAWDLTMARIGDGIGWDFRREPAWKSFVWNSWQRGVD